MAEGLFGMAVGGLSFWTSGFERGLLVGRHYLCALRKKDDQIWRNLSRDLET